VQKAREVGPAPLWVLAEPDIGNGRDRARHGSGGPAGQPLIGAGQAPGAIEQHVLGDHWKRRPGGRSQRSLAVLAEERRAVVDQPGAPVPDEQVGVAGCPVDIGDQGVEPHEIRRLLGAEPVRGRGRKGQRAGQEIYAEVGADAGERELLDLDVGLGLGQVGVELGHDQLGDEEAECARELAGHDLGDECGRSLARPGELHHVETVVVSFHERRQRAALAQRGDVAGGGDLAQRHGRLRYPGAPTR
jgi:hypothetical protein